MDSRTEPPAQEHSTEPVPHALIVGPQSSGQLYPSAARAMGMGTTVITTDREDFRLSESAKAAADEIVRTRGVLIEELRPAVEEVHRRHPITAVVPGDEFVVEQTAILAADLGLPGLSPATVAAVRDKAVMRARLHEAGVTAPKFVRARDAVEVAAAGAAVGFPCVVKPTSMAGTVGVTRVDDAAGLERAYQAILEEREPVSGCLPGAEVVVESYLAGPEFSVEGYVDGRDRVHVLAITEKRLGPEPAFQQRAHFVRPAASVPGHERISAYVGRVTRALGIVVGAFHAELRLTDRGPVLIEIAARPAGDHIAEMVETVTGVSLIGASLAVLAGLPVPEAGPARAAVAGIHYASEPGLIGRSYRELAGWDEAVALPGVVEACVHIEAGAPIPARHDYRSRVAHVRFTAPDFARATALRDRLDRLIRVRG
ncbi:ATP-grasp domain-containing protein [Streptomycetaceae bacterium NBC_01309]